MQLLKIYVCGAYNDKTPGRCRRASPVPLQTALPPGPGPWRVRASEADAMEAGLGPFCLIEVPMARSIGGIHLLKSGYRPVAGNYSLLLSRNTIKGALPYNLAVMIRCHSPHQMQPLSARSSLP